MVGAKENGSSKMASVHYIKYKKVTDRRRNNAIGKWDLRYKKLYRAMKLEKPTRASGLSTGQRVGCSNNENGKKILGISRQSIVNQYGRSASESKNGDLIDRVFPTPPQDRLNVLSMIPNVNFKDKHCPVSQSKQHEQKRSTLSISRNERKMKRPKKSQPIPNQSLNDPPTAELQLNDA